MRLQHTIDVGRAVQLDVVAGLDDINAIIARADAVASGNSLVIDVGNEFLGNGGITAGNSIIIDLTAEKNSVAVNSATIDVALMRSGAKIMLGEDVVDHPFPKSASFGVTLKGLEHRDDMSRGVDVGAVALAVP